MESEWDPAKAAANLHAHGVAFSDAATVFEDERALTREDPDAVGERRFVTLGMSGHGNLLVVVCSLPERQTVRIISAWKANRRQRLQYEKHSR